MMAVSSFSFSITIDGLAKGIKMRVERFVLAALLGNQGALELSTWADFRL